MARLDRDVAPSKIANHAGEEMTEDKRLDIAQKAQRWGRAYIQSSPLALSLREVNRLMAFALLAEQDKQERGEVMPVLDVGCGDGVWWMLLDVDRGLVYGVDISGSEIKRAQKHIHAVLADISKVRPFPEVSFPTVLANCSLEHVPDIQGALDTIRRCAIEKNGRLVLFVPAVQWGYQGMIQAFFLRHAPRLAMSLSGALNGFFQHWHLYDLSVWESILARSGWKTRGHGWVTHVKIFISFVLP